MSAVTSASLLALAARFEAGRFPNIELDRAMVAVINPNLLRNYSGSVDDALCALGKGWSWRRLTEDCMSVYRRSPAIGPADRFDGYHSEPARALCAAILKAKADSLAISEKASA